MCGVIHAIQKWNLSLVPFDLHVLSIHNQSATEAFSVAVVMRHIVVMRKKLQLFYDPCVCSIKTFANTMSNGSNTQSFQMKTEKRFRIFSTKIYIETCMAILTMKSVYSSACTLFPEMIGGTGRTMWTTALRSPFLNFDMLNGENVAKTSYKVPFLSAKNRTLSIIYL